MQRKPILCIFVAHHRSAECWVLSPERGTMSKQLSRQQQPTQHSGLSTQHCLVMKFGGTSVGGGRQLRAVAAIVADHRAERPVVVASAMRGVTDRLLAAAGA